MAVTIRNYAASLAKPLKLGFGIDTKSEEFKESINAFFLQNPPEMKRIPSWSLEKVLQLLESKPYDNQRTTIYKLLRKTVFLTALASGNRVSEIAALDVTGALGRDQSGLTLAVKPGFLFKNQMANPLIAFTI